MNAVTIWDTIEAPTGGRLLAFDLRDILDLAKAKVSSSTWRCRDVETIGPGSAELHDASDGNRILNGAAFLEHAQQLHQTLEGEFIGLLAGSNAPWLIVRVIRSTEFAVVTDDPALLAKVRQRFRDVRDSPGDVYDVT